MCLIKYIAVLHIRMASAGLLPGFCPAPNLEVERWE